MKRVAVAIAVLALAGCGGGAAEQAKPKQPRLAHDLAASWAAQSDHVAGALAEGDGCTAQQVAANLQSQFIAAVNEGRVPRRLQEPLGAAFNDLHARITCIPPQPTEEKDHGHEKHKQHTHGKHGDDDKYERASLHRASSAGPRARPAHTRRHQSRKRSRYRYTTGVV